MSEETPVKRGRGRPRKVQLTPRVHEDIRPAVRDEVTKRSVQVGREHREEWDHYEDDDGTVDRFHIPKHMFPDGLDLRWVRTATAGKSDPSNVSEAHRKGWSVVNGQDFQGAFDGMFMPKGHKGPIEIDGLTLHCRPLEFSLKAKARERRNAVEQVQRKEAEMLGGTIPGVSKVFDTNHPSARRVNRLNKTMETIAVPDE